MASKHSLASQCGAKHRVGRLAVAKCKADVAYAIERHHAVLALRRIVLLAERLAQMQRTVVIVYCLVEHSHATEVGANVVESLHKGYGVAHLLRQVRLPMVTVDGLHKLIVLAVGAPETLARAHLKDTVATLMGRLNHAVQAFLTISLGHNAIGSGTPHVEVAARWAGTTRLQQAGKNCQQHEMRHTAMHARHHGQQTGKCNRQHLL